jgi:type IV pilus assembly protein PilB
VNDRRERVLLRTASASGGAAEADSGETPAGSRFGELLVDEALITPDQLTEALRVQSTMAAYMPLGEILMLRGWLTRTQLTGLLRRHRKRARLGDLLVRAKRITPEQLQTALARQQQIRQPLGRTLMALGYVTEVTMREALCAQMQVNFFDLDPIPLDPALANLVNVKYALKRKVVPIFRAERTLVVAVDDPTDITIVEDLQQLAQLRVEIVTSTAEKIQRALARLYKAASGPNVDPCLHPNIMMGAVHDPEVADLAARVLRVKVLPLYWQTS